MKKITDISSLRNEVESWRQVSESVALVPTMGNLHKGHINLFKLAHEHADRLIVSIFVNPTQFGPGDDYAEYPRTLDADARRLARCGADILFSPSAEEIYPEGCEQMTSVSVKRLSGMFCGVARPEHFEGVTSIVCRLFNIVAPDIAVFGQKDYQQLAVIRKLVADLHMPIEIIGVPIVRADDGLALSSRNGYLSEQERAIAPTLYRTLCELRDALAQGESAEQVLQRGKTALYDAGFTPDYLELRDATLKPVAASTRHAVLLAAAKLGPARLIDNLSVQLPSAATD